MAKVITPKGKESPKPIRPALTPEALENQAISLAYDRAIEQLQDGTASSQVITYFLKLGGEKERLEKERLIEENKLLRAKTVVLEDQKDLKQMYMDAINAMRNYNGQGDPDDY